ncbi:tRNA-guanine transglycosylases, various specificities family protein [Trichomonas vaginalis G3]|uniref:tRNA-guanine transglycosylases, various specificities family protein n=1 Tax=Trichomonas vaginalis (strain ATCC PRA-98 / G3) TaxID=412133 RepID=A2FGP8_TRIV3|nr:queuine tRNA-ribosyltransferase protein [Trichomonas vaginalis G3]EAX95930.1 tRNA-guanine transglycosylases, various specificities family protein [Trichomonas vaginalis G3]KAI5540140.1 queuine tRNA-ribosyltransferase protein [Trichomonas vaginalis G3]|eukprot:XP_001308860.1 tRNA-guanine transglycosylases, various specificities family protein [Trichomonas vaginalis G3]
MSRVLKLEDPQGENEPLETPCFVVPTEMGLIPNITPDLSDNFPLFYYAGDFYKAALPKSVKASDALGFTKRWIFFGPAADFYNFDEGPSKKGVRLYQRNSNLIVVSKEDYENMVNYVKPQGTVSLYSHLQDNTTGRQKNLRTTTNKEFATEYPKTLNFTVATAEKPETGFFAQYPIFSEKEAEAVKEILATRNQDAPRMLYCDGHPTDIRRAIDTGFDIIVAQYPTYMATHGYALNFDFERGKEGESLGLDLRSREFEHDHRPLVEGCDCICCRNHSRSYLHHLLNVHEILGQVFLSQHNLYHYRRFFEYIRKELSQ